MNYFRACTVSIALLCAWDAFGSDVSPGEIRGKSSKEPVTVLQNRYFLKSYRPEVGFSTGVLLDEAYTKTSLYGVRAGLFLNEWAGIEVQSLRTSVADSQDRKALNTLKFRPLDSGGGQGAGSGNATAANGATTTTIVSPDPEVNSIHSVNDFNVIAAPFYGKLNVINKWIIYTDLYATAGISQLVTDQGGKTGQALGIGERFYIGQAWSVRIDFKDRIFTESRGGQDSTRNSKAVDFGASYFFN